MIPIKPQPEPSDFDQMVRKKGSLFLNKCPKPAGKQWHKKEYWRDIIKPFYDAYGGICAYSAHWIPFTDNPNVDHYIPKAVRPDLAYEWDNYRLSCSLANNLKRDFQDVLDPFHIHKDMFFLDFPSLLVIPNPAVNECDKKKVLETRDRLKLNDDRYITVRSRWLKLYCKEGLTFSGLKESAPFIAYELERQDLVENIKNIMIYGPETEEY